MLLFHLIRSFIYLGLLEDKFSRYLDRWVFQTTGKLASYKMFALYYSNTGNYPKIWAHIKNMGPGAKLPGFESQLHHTLTV